LTVNKAHPRKDRVEHDRGNRSYNGGGHREGYR
jgi:hypothetical protein